MELKRLFIGTFVDQTLFEPVYGEIEYEIGEVAFGKWTEINNLHFTYKFLGNVEVSKIDLITATLGDLLKEYESPLKINGLGAFPSAKKPRIVFAKITNHDRSVYQAYQKVESLMKSIGFAPETKKFFPHITLMRVKSSLTGFADKLLSFNNLPIGIMPTYKINLVESTLTNKGPIYNILA